MTPQQREAALRLADDMDTPISVWADHVAHLLRELASEPVQEPVCWGWRVPDGRITAIFSERKDNPDLEVVALYAAPPQRELASEPQAEPVRECADNDSPWLICKPCAPTYTEQQIADACMAAEVPDSKCESVLLALRA